MESGDKYEDEVLGKSCDEDRLGGVKLCLGFVPAKTRSKHDGLGSSVLSYWAEAESR